MSRRTEFPGQVIQVRLAILLPLLPGPPASGGHFWEQARLVLQEKLLHERQVVAGVRKTANCSRHCLRRNRDGLWTDILLSVVQMAALCLGSSGRRNFGSFHSSNVEDLIRIPEASQSTRQVGSRVISSTDDHGMMRCVFPGGVSAASATSGAASIHWRTAVWFECQTRALSPRCM